METNHEVLLCRCSNWIWLPHSGQLPLWLTFTKSYELTSQNGKQICECKSREKQPQDVFSSFFSLFPHIFEANTHFLCMYEINVEMLRHRPTVHEDLKPHIPLTWTGYSHTHTSATKAYTWLYVNKIKLHSTHCSPVTRGLPRKTEAAHASMMMSLK